MMRIKEMCLVAMMTTLIAIGAFIQLPISIVPMTLQTLFVLSCALILERKSAMCAVLLYLFMGLIGLPVFAKGGGISYILQPTFGYLLGFVLCVYVIGKMKSATHTTKERLLISIIGLLLIYGVGILYFVIIQATIYELHYSIEWLFYTLFLVYFPSDLVLCILAVLLSKRLRIGGYNSCVNVKE